MKDSFRLLGNLFIILAVCLNTTCLNAQSNDSIATAYLDHIKTPREVAYLHLNKSTYIKGELIGFTAYVLDKRSQRPTRLSQNLFVTVEDKNKRVVSQKLLKLNNGIASNVIALDTNYTSGYYTVKAFTNWMRNFEEQDYFVETIRVIDLKEEEFIETETVESAIDAQFLPESGHLVSDIENTVSVVVKDKKGYGVPNLRGKIYDKEQTLITEFRVNHLGIGRFNILPNENDQFFVEFNFLNEDYRFKIDHKIEPIGIVLSVAESNNKVYATLKTNSKSMPILSQNSYQLYLHNQNGASPIEIFFRDSHTITKVFDLTQLPTGINTLTLFDENRRPILERQFFNYNNLTEYKTTSVQAKKEQDSINLSFSIINLNPRLPHNISVSVLPSETESYNRNNNIISYNLLQPYIKGAIEQAGYYFKDVDRKVKHELDNLLISQGWSSYDWTDIFSDKVLRFPVEQGITVKASVNNDNTKRTDGYMFQLTDKDKPLIVEPDERSFVVNNVFLEEGQDIYIAEIKKNASLRVPKLYVQSFPNRIPALDIKHQVLKPKQNYFSYTMDNNEMTLKSIDQEQELDEVLITGQLERDRARVRARKLGDGFGDVKVITSEDRKAFFYLEDYLMTASGVMVNLGRTNVSFTAFRNIGLGNATPMSIFIDDAYFGRTLPPKFLFMANVDYVIVNVTGLGSAIGQGSFRGSGGVIRVYTSPKEILDTSNQKKGQKYNLPLKFAAKKRFYVPKYKYYNDDFYLKYGTIDWKPQLVSSDNSRFNLKIKTPDIPVTLYIEGMANDGSLISEEKSIVLD